MELSDTLLCLFSSEIDHQDSSYTIEIPDCEVELGDLEPDRPYRVALVPQARTQPDSNINGNDKSAQATAESDPPVAEGDHRTVEIETIGEQGDGIARAEQGYVVIVPDTDPHERIEIEIRRVTNTVAFAEVVERCEDHE